MHYEILIPPYKIFTIPAALSRRLILPFNVKHLTLLLTGHKMFVVWTECFGCVMINDMYSNCCVTWFSSDMSVLMYCY